MLNTIGKMFDLTSEWIYVPFCRLTIQLHSFRNAFSDRLSFDIEEFPRFFRSHATSKQEKKKVHDPLLGALEAHALEINPEVKL